MLLDDAEFLRIKERYVAEVLDKLRGFARWEATLLLAEARRRSRTPLTELATQVSKAMNNAADLVHKAVEAWSTDDPLYRSIVLEHVPAALAEAISGLLTIPVIGIGAGERCDGQVRVTADLLGLTPRQPPFSRPLIDGRGLAIEALRGWISAQGSPTRQAAPVPVAANLPSSGNRSSAD
jgi:hypothetical protein